MAPNYESFTFGSETVGGSSPTHTSAILDHYMFTTNEDQASFVVRFVVTGTSISDLNTQCLAVEAALRQRYQKLTVDWSPTNVETFDPAAAQSTGFSAEPELRKLTKDEFPNSGLARGYEWSCKIGQAPNYTDTFGAANGRRQVDVNFHYDTDQFLVGTFSVEWTQAPSLLARQKFLAIFEGASGYAAYRLSLINTAYGGSSTAYTWTITKKDDSDPNDLSVCRSTRVYEQHINGRRGSTLEIFFGPQSLRTTTIRGTYYRTISGVGGAFGNVFGSANDSLTNFLDATNGGQAFAEGTTLPNIPSGQGGALTAGANCELLGSPFQTTNEQKDRTEYNLVYQELQQKQSNAAGGFLDDPNIIDDKIFVAAQFNEVNDSPSPPPASSVKGPGGASTPAPSAQVQNSTTLQTYSAPATPNQATGAPGTQTTGGAAASLVPSKPVDVYIQYEAFFKKSITALENYFAAQVFPLLVLTLEQEFGLTVTEVVEHKPKFDKTKNKAFCETHLRVYGGNVVLFTYTQGRHDDTGVKVDPAYTGFAHDYLVQQGLPKATMTRHVEAVYKTGQFSLDQFVTPQAMTGWVLLETAQPQTTDRILGIPSLGLPQQPLTYATLDEALIWVRSNVALAGGAGTTGGSTTTNLPNAQAPQQPAAPRIATGVGG